MNKLSAREQVLLFVLAMVALFAGGFQFLILPGLSNITFSEMNLATLHEEKTAQIMAIEEATAYQGAYEENLREIEAAKKKLLPVMRSEQLEGLLTETFLRYNLTPQSVVVNMAPPPIDEPAEQSVREGESAAPPPTNYTYYSIQATVSGKYDEFLGLVDELNKNASFVVKQYSYQRNLSDAYLGWKFGLLVDEALEQAMFENQEWLYATISFSMDVYVYDDEAMKLQSTVIGPMIEG